MKETLDSEIQNPNIDPQQLFMNELKAKRFRKIAAKEEKTLLKDAQSYLRKMTNGVQETISDIEVESFQKLMDSQIRLVVKIAKTYRSRIPLIEMINEGSLGLIAAIQKFDLKKETRLTTMTNNWVKSYLRRMLAENRTSVKLTNYIFTEIGKMMTTVSELQQELGRNPTVDEIHKRFGHTKKQVIELLRLQQDPISLNFKAKNEIEVGEKIADKKFIDPEENELKREQKRLLAKALISLTPLERQVLLEKYDFLGTNDQYLDISTRKKNQIEEKALSKLRANKELFEFFRE